MKKFIYLFALSCFSTFSSAQDYASLVVFNENSEILDFPASETSSPKLNPGAEALDVFFQKNLKYPDKGYEYGIVGSVILQVNLDKYGKVRHSTVVKSLEKSFDKEAQRVAGIMPAWQPAILNGRNVASSFQLTINFK